MVAILCRPTLPAFSAQSSPSVKSAAAIRFFSFFYQNESCAGRTPPQAAQYFMLADLRYLQPSQSMAPQAVSAQAP
jgi:hypothetical protein